MHLQADGRTCEKPIQCKGSEFHCKTGECISDSLRCNHKNDCPERDDELHCAHYAIECPRGKFSCQNGEKCLDDYTKCDGHSDCWDRSDEMNCHIHNSSCPQGNILDCNLLQYLFRFIYLTLELLNAEWRLNSALLNS